MTFPHQLPAGQWSSKAFRHRRLWFFAARSLEKEWAMGLLDYKHEYEGSIDNGGRDRYD